ncbi:hypothetical protein CVT24_008339 [Panaeolus cyanescens]|uniref:DUF7719 domain-containing protein n=1 Tax=Panaeolus cyanescens TaxID=181874 RepID=A0A409VCD7_9AGAR|nr:hypothetical protein CVT24_008339 [Panaeolus cyanescens]
MPSRRKAGAQKDVPLKSPSSIPTPQTKPLIDIPEDEQWRIIKESGILNSVKPETVPSQKEPEELTLGDEIFNAVLYIIPFSSLLILMEILVRQQYGRKATVDDLTERIISGVPILSIFIFYTMRYKPYRKMQIFLFIISVLCGSRLLYQVNNANWLTVMRQGPPFATVWIYTIVQLDLGPAVLALLTVASYCWWKELTILR